MIGIRLGPSREIVCRQAVELVTDYLEGALPRSRRRRLESHLAGCVHCREYLAQMREAIRLTGTVTADDLSPQAQDELVAIFRRWQKDEAREQ